MSFIIIITTTKTEQMTNKDAFTYGEIIGELMGLETLYLKGDEEKQMLQATISKMESLFNSLNK